MSIGSKIEEIRRKPEHIRLYYVWGMVAISMLFVFMLWVFSLKENVREIKNGQTPLSDLSEQIKDAPAGTNMGQAGEIAK